MSRRSDAKGLAVAVIGAAGRMGREVIAALAGRSDAFVASAVEHADHPLLGTDMGSFVGGAPTGVVITSEISEALSACRVAIDFSTPETVEALAFQAAEADVALVTGTTSLDERARKALARASERIAVLASPNMSVGIHLLRRLTELAASSLGRDYDLEIVEIHHRHKKDAPSGTALMLSEAAAAAKGLDMSTSATYGRKGLCGPRRPDEIGVFALRAGEVVGDHMVLLAGPGERLELVHRASSRSSFALGAIRAALWIADQPPGLYEMGDLLGLAG